MDYVRYLKSKQTVDDRALNECVLRDAEQYVQRRYTQLDQSCPLKIVEVGAGVGGMCCRLFLRGTFSKFKCVEYLLIDFKADAILMAKHAIQRLKSNCTEKRELDGTKIFQTRPYVTGSELKSVHHQRSGKAGEGDSEPDLSGVQLNDNFSVSFAVCDALEYARSHAKSFDFVIGAAVLDLWELTSSVPLLLSMLRADGLNAYYFPINFDGTTAFLPPTSEGADFDGRVETHFHQAMGFHTAVVTNSTECRIPAAHTGRHLLSVLIQAGAQIRSAGSSGWIVLPSTKEAGSYAHDEKYFLQCIIDFIQISVPGVRSDDDGKEWDAPFQRYIADRRKQIEQGELSYVAHNIDVFGTYCGGT